MTHDTLIYVNVKMFVPLNYFNDLNASVYLYDFDPYYDVIFVYITF